MNELCISEEAAVMLRSFGWSEDRDVDCEESLSFLRAGGIDVSEIASAFLRSFSGISLDLPDGGVSGIKFDITWAMTFFAFEEVFQLEAIIGKRLCPIGYGGRFLLLIAADAEAIFLHDEWFMLLRTQGVYKAFELMRDLNFRDFEEVMLEDRKPINVDH